MDQEKARRLAEELRALADAAESAAAGEGPDL